jgi:voltage-gated potassium channel
VRLSLARDRQRFVRTHVLDLIVLLAPMARPLRALRVIAMIGTVNRRMRGSFRAKVGVYVVTSTVLVGTVASLSVLDAERYAPHATIKTFGDAVWWTLSTISTVGYGDLYPVTTEGRLVASTLMIAGIALVGVITGSFATWFVDNLGAVEEEVEEAGDRTAAQIHQVLVEVRSLSRRIQVMEENWRQLAVNSTSAGDAIEESDPADIEHSRVRSEGTQPTP